MTSIGVMAMPVDFPYRDVFLRGKPKHDRFDVFSSRHPKMNLGRRAKIFSPFDALKGFNEAISSKDVLYYENKELSAEDRQELNHRLNILKNLTFNSRMARANHVIVTVVYYVPCADENNEAYGLRGSYSEITGLCKRVDEIQRTIQVDEKRIRFDDILRVENENGIFQKDWNAEYSSS